MNLKIPRMWLQNIPTNIMCITNAAGMNMILVKIIVATKNTNIAVVESLTVLANRAMFIT